MSKYSFLDDYSEGCHPNILKSLAASNLEQQIAYGDDKYSIEAKQHIYKHLGQTALDNSQKHTSEIFFVSGGTQANLIITAASLRSHEAVISANTGHVLGREAGALEATGHKVISVNANNGKLTDSLIQEALDQHSAAPHMVKPKMVYISNATEIGSIYDKTELQAISQFCRKNDLYFLLDGARLGSALTSKNNDVTLKDLAELTDVFWIGGTKAGALIGEAIVINHPTIINDFDFHIKQRGAMLAKGRLLGIQFLELFKDDLFFELSQKANQHAEKISNTLLEKGYQLSAETSTNQIFPILSNDKIAELEQNFAFYRWAKHDDKHSVIRLVTSWATDQSQLDNFLQAL